MSFQFFVTYITSFFNRAVANYLQTLFDKEAVNGMKVLLMDNLLSGKTRKEASRMFFETLVCVSHFLGFKLVSLSGRFYHREGTYNLLGKKQESRFC